MYHNFFRILELLIFDVAKRILHYVKGTIDKGIVFYKLMNPPKSLLVAFSDSDWTGDPDDCPSKMGACILLVGN